MRRAFARIALWAMTVAGICVSTEGTRSIIAGDGDGGPTVAFLGLVGRDAGDPRRRKAVGDVDELTDIQLSAWKTARLVDRSKIVDVLEEHKLAASGLTDMRQCIHVGKLLRAEIVAYLTTEPDDKTPTHVRLHVVESATGTIRAVHAYEVGKESRTEGLASDIASDIRRAVFTTSPAQTTVAVRLFEHRGRFSRYNFLEVGFRSALVSELMHFPSLRVLERENVEAISREDALMARTGVVEHPPQRQARFLVAGQFHERIEGTSAFADVEILLLDGATMTAVWSNRSEVAVAKWRDACSPWATDIGRHLSATNEFAVATDRRAEAEVLWNQAVWHLSHVYEGLFTRADFRPVPLVPNIAVEGGIIETGGGGSQPNVDRALNILDCLEYLRPGDPQIQVLLAHSLFKHKFMGELYATPSGGDATYERIMALVDSVTAAGPPFAHQAGGIRMSVYEALNHYHYCKGRDPKDRQNTDKAREYALRLIRECIRTGLYSKAADLCTRGPCCASLPPEFDGGSDPAFSGSVSNVALNLCERYLKQYRDKSETDYWMSRGAIVFNALYLKMPYSWRNDAAMRQRCEALLGQCTNSTTPIFRMHVYAGLARHAIWRGDFAAAARLAGEAMAVAPANPPPQRHPYMVISEDWGRGPIDVVVALAEDFGVAGRFREQAEVLDSGEQVLKHTRYSTKDERFEKMRIQAYLRSDQIDRACRMYENQLNRVDGNYVMKLPRILWGPNGHPAPAITPEKPDYTGEWYFWERTPPDVSPLQVCGDENGFWILFGISHRWFRYFDLKSLAFTQNITGPEITVGSCGSSPLSAQFGFHGNKIYLASYGVGLKEYDISSKTWRMHPASASLPSTAIHVVATHGDDVYVGFYEGTKGGVAVLRSDGTSKVFQGDGTPSCPVRSLATDEHRLWVNMGRNNKLAGLVLDSQLWEVFDKTSGLMAPVHGGCFVLEQDHNPNYSLFFLSNTDKRRDSLPIHFTEQCKSVHGCLPVITTIMPWEAGILLGGGAYDTLHSNGLYFRDSKGTVHNYGPRNGLRNNASVEAIRRVGRDVWVATGNGLLRLRPAHNEPVTNSPPVIWCDWPAQIVRTVRNAAARGGYDAVNAATCNMVPFDLDGIILLENERLKVLVDESGTQSTRFLQAMSDSVKVLSLWLRNDWETAREVWTGLGDPRWAYGRIPPLPAYMELLATAVKQKPDSNVFSWEAAGMIFETGGDPKMAATCYEEALLSTKDKETFKRITDWIEKLSVQKTESQRPQ